MDCYMCSAQYCIYQKRYRMKESAHLMRKHIYLFGFFCQCDEFVYFMYAVLHTSSVSVAHHFYLNRSSNARILNIFFHYFRNCPTKFMHMFLQCNVEIVYILFQMHPRAARSIQTCAFYYENHAQPTSERSI